MERSNWAVIVCVAVGSAGILLALLPSPWPNPLGNNGVVATEKTVPLVETAAAVDAACRKGDANEFAALTTASYRRVLERRLDALDATLDSDTLRQIAAAGGGYAGWLRRPVWAAHVKDSYAAVIVSRPDLAGEKDGAQVLVFQWDGEQFQLDEVRHATRVFTEPAAKRYAKELLRLR